MIARLALLFYLLFPLLARADGVEPKDQFKGDQLLYELSYTADFYIGLVTSLVGNCTGLAAPLFMYKLPNPSFAVKQVMLGGRFGFIGFVYPNPYSGKHFGGDSEDPRRPSTLSQRVADELFVAAQEGEVVGYLCDIHLWDLIEDYAGAQLALVNYALEGLALEQRDDDAENLILKVSPLFEKMQRFVNGDPNRERGWRYELYGQTFD